LINNILFQLKTGMDYKYVFIIIILLFGTPNGSNGSYIIGGCHSSNSQTIVESYCVGNNSCSIPATNSVFGDPCRGTYKSLNVKINYIY